MSNENIIAVRTSGVADTDIVSSTFRVSTKGHGLTGQIAKSVSKSTIDAIKQTIEAFSGKAGIDTSRIKTSFSVDTNRLRNSDEFSGYKSEFKSEFICTNVEETLNLHDALTSIDGCESPTPVFNLSQSDGAYARAFSAAFSAATEKFKNQCDTVGYDYEQFELVNWYVQEEEPRGKMLSLTGSGPTQIVTGIGKAQISLSVTFNFVMKTV